MCDTTGSHIKNDIVVMLGGSNTKTITQGNAADKIAGHRSGSYDVYPVPGEYHNNLNGYLDSGGSVESQLTDPAAYDFRPKPGSTLDILGIGAYESSDNPPWTAGTTARFEFAALPNY